MGEMDISYYRNELKKTELMQKAMLSYMKSTINNEELIMLSKIVTDFESSIVYYNSRIAELVREAEYTNILMETKNEN